MVVNGHMDPKLDIQTSNTAIAPAKSRSWIILIISISACSVFLDPEAGDDLLFVCARAPLTLPVSGLLNMMTIF